MTTTLSLFAGAGAQFFDNDGNPLSGGKIYSYMAGSSTPATTYTTIAGNISHSNPIVLDSAGRVPGGGEIWLTLGVGYKFIVKTSADVLIATYDNIPSAAQPPAANDADSIMYEQGYTVTAGNFVVGKTYRILAVGNTNFTAIGASSNTPGTHFIATGVGSGTGTAQLSQTVQARLRQVVSVADFGAVGDGSTDDTEAIRAAVASLTTGGELVFPNPSVSYLITGTIEVTVGNVTLTGTGNDCHIQMNDGTITGFQVNGTSGVTIRGFKFSCKNQTNQTAYVAAVSIYNSSICYVDKCSVFNVAFWGVSLFNANNCSVTNCSFGAWWGNQQDSANIAVYRQSSYNLIQGNVCGGSGADHGILVQDPYAGTTPTGNIIDSNRIVGNHNAYGIVIYVTTVYDTKHIVTNNYIEGVLGTQLAGASGSGIYLQTANGTVCANNEVYNCCQQTTNFGTLGIAHIAAQTGDAATYPGAFQFTPIVVSNNKIRAVKGVGIWGSASYASVIIDGNSIFIEDTASSNSEAIKISSCDNAIVSNNAIIHKSTGTSAISALALIPDQHDLQITGNMIKTVGSGITVNQAYGNNWLSVVVANNNVQNTSNGTAYFFEAINRCSFVGNQCTTDSGQLYVTNCTYFRGSDNNLYTNSVSGGYTVNFVNTCTGSLLDKTNRYNGVMNNDATGFSLEFYANAVAPMSGKFAVNDRVVNSEASLGEPSGWVCTVAGTPGTWAVTGQCGYRTGTAAPAVNSYFIGEEFLDSTNNIWYKSKNVGTGASDWIALN